MWPGNSILVLHQYQPVSPAGYKMGICAAATQLWDALLPDLGGESTEANQKSSKATLLRWQSWPTFCSVTHTGRERKNKFCLLHFVPLPCNMFGDSKPSYTHGFADPSMSPRGRHMQTNTHAHREQVCLFFRVCFVCFLFYSQCYLAAVILRQATPSFHPACSENKAFWIGIWAAAA